MVDKLEVYRRGEAPKGGMNRRWPLYGAGIENLGRDGQPVATPLPTIGPDELLVRHDACGLCFSDIKVIKQGQEHPRIHDRDISRDPLVLGHEVAMTVVDIGASLAGQFRRGQRFIIQADIRKNGVGYAYGYMLPGGLAEYGVIDQRVLAGDDGNYLLPVQPGTGYAESALTEPWACVTAAYELKYRTGLKAGGVTWIVGGPGSSERNYTCAAGFEPDAHPAQVMLTGAPQQLAAWLRGRATALGIEVLEAPDPARPPLAQADDIIILQPTPELVELVSPRLADFGICALIGDRPLARTVQVDIGRVHYDRWLYVGGTGPDISRAYSGTPVRANLRPGGVTWMVGAGGPMGRMHVQRALQAAGAPATLICSDVSDTRLADLCESFAEEAASRGCELVCLNPTQSEAFAAGMARFRERGCDDIVVLAPLPAVIAEAATWLAAGGVMNVFAGVGRGTMASLDLSDAFLRQVRIIGHSASSIEDLRFMLLQAETGVLSPNRSVAAIGSLEAARDGMQALMDASYPGKVVIYPLIKPFPLTSLAELKDVLPSVYAKLKDGREWTNEAEEEFLRLMLP